MDVVRSNFEQAVAAIEQLLLKTVVFISFDLEMSGITIKPEYYYDTPDQRYTKSQEVASKFSIIQIGLCFFIKESPTDEELKVYPFNFFVFPGTNSGTNQITLDVSAIDFLRDQKMNFQKWIYDGIPYINGRNEKKLQSYYHLGKPTREESKSPKKEEEVKEANKPVREEKMVLDNEKEQEIVNECIENFKVFMDKEPLNAELKIPSLNPKLRRYMHLFMENGKYPIQKETIAVPGPGRLKEIVVKKLTEEEFQLQVVKKREEEYNSKVGFRRVWNMIKGRKTPYIGHNCFMDLMFMYSHFENPLPPSLDQFRHSIHKIFPNIYDTKNLIYEENVQKEATEVNPFPEVTALEHVYIFCQNLNREKSIVKYKAMESDFSRYLDTKGKKVAIFHEAGFDAYVTGYSYAVESAILTKEKLDANRNIVPSFRSCYLNNFNEEGEEILHDNVKLLIGKTKPGVNLYDFGEEVFDKTLATEENTGKYIRKIVGGNLIVVINDHEIEEDLRNRLSTMEQFEYIFNWKEWTALCKIIESERMGSKLKPKKELNKPKEEKEVPMCDIPKP